MLKDRVKVSTTTEGTGILTLRAPDNGFQGFDSISGQTYYAITNKNQWEVGVGTYSSGLFSRDVVYDSSDSGNLILLSGKSTIFVTYPAAKAIYLSPSANSTYGDFLVSDGISWDSRPLSSGDVFSAIGYIPPSSQKIYSASSGIVSVDDTFITSGDAHFSSVAINSNILTSSGSSLVWNGNFIPTGDFPTYSANSGIALSNNNFRMNGTGTLSSLEFINERNNIVLIGTQSARDVKIGYAAGEDALFFDAVAIGTYPLAYAVGDAADNTVAIGNFPLSESDTPLDTVAIGNYAGFQAKSPWYSTFLGSSAGTQSSGQYNVYIGKNAGSANTGSNNVEIVAQKSYAEIFYNQSNKLHIGKIILGDTNSKKLAIGNVSSSNLNPNATLEILPKVATDKAFLVKGAASQSASLIDAQKSDGSSVFSVFSDGRVSGVNAILSSGIILYSGVPSNTNSALYSSGSALLWNNKQVFNNKIVEISGSYNANGTEDVFIIHSGQLNLFHPTGYPEYYGIKYNIKATNSGVSVVPSGTIDGSSSSIIFNRNDAMTIISTSNGWYILSKYSTVIDGNL